MRIVEEGPADFSHEFTCSQCKTKLEANAEDVRVGDFGSLGEYERAYYVECPVCHNEHLLDEKQIPFRVRQKANAKGTH